MFLYMNAFKIEHIFEYGSIHRIYVDNIQWLMSLVYALPKSKSVVHNIVTRTLENYEWSLIAREAQIPERCDRWFSSNKNVDTLRKKYCTLLFAQISC